MLGSQLSRSALVRSPLIPLPLLRKGEGDDGETEEGCQKEIGKTEASLRRQSADREGLRRCSGQGLHRRRARVAARCVRASRCAYHPRRAGREESGEVEFAVLRRRGGALV